MSESNFHTLVLLNLPRLEISYCAVVAEVDCVIRELDGEVGKLHFPDEDGLPGRPSLGNPRIGARRCNSHLCGGRSQNSDVVQCAPRFQSSITPGPTNPLTILDIPAPQYHWVRSPSYAGTAQPGWLSTRFWISPQEWQVLSDYGGHNATKCFGPKE